MNNVLSIDIDVCFNGETFANYIQHDIDAEDSWAIIKYLNSTNKYGIDIKADEYTVNKIAKILMKKCNGAKAHIITEHDEILPILKSEGESAVYNIDFHCDTTYGGDDTKPNIENWVRHGYSQRTIKEYHWICRPMSDNCPFVLPYTRDNIEDIDVDVLPKFNTVVLCVSKHFTPIDYWDVMINYFKEVQSNGIR